jgi:hypothetical protein
MTSPAPPLPITGGCLCRAVRYESAAAPVLARLCWCRVCQYLAAGNATVNLVFPATTVRIEGAPRDYRSIADSGNVMHRRFCGACGTPLFSAAEARPHLVIVRAGTLDDPDLARPAMTIWAASAPRYACFDASVPRIEGQPP